jgi:hypothetical protein
MDDLPRAGRSSHLGLRRPFQADLRRRSSRAHCGSDLGHLCICRLFVHLYVTVFNGDGRKDTIHGLKAGKGRCGFKKRQ